MRDGGGGRGGGSALRRGGSGFKAGSSARGARGGRGVRGSFGGRGKGIGSGGRGRGRGNTGGRGAGAPSKVVITPHRHEGVFTARGGKADALVTRNLVPGESVYAEKRLEVTDESGEKIEYRTWNPFRSKLGGSILGGVKYMPIKPGVKVLYLGAANGTTVSHVSDIVGPDGMVYAVEFSHRSGRDLTNMAKKRQNIVPIIEDARCPLKYRMLVSMVDVIFSDVAQPDQSRIVVLNAQHFLKTGGWFIISIKANCVDSTVKPEVVYASEVQALREQGCKPKEQLTLEPYHRDHAVVIGQYRPIKSNPSS